MQEKFHEYMRRQWEKFLISTNNHCDTMAVRVLCQAHVLGVLEENSIHHMEIERTLQEHYSRTCPK